jgi:hypothetical protein
MKVKPENLRRHIKKTHPSKLNEYFRSDRIPKKDNGPDALPEYKEPVDFLDLPIVVSGGGFGVGKKKR